MLDENKAELSERANQLAKAENRRADVELLLQESEKKLDDAEMWLDRASAERQRLLDTIASRTAEAVPHDVGNPVSNFSADGPKTDGSNSRPYLASTEEGPPPDVSRFHSPS